MDPVVTVPSRTATLAVEPFAIAHCATCHVTRNLAASDPLTGEAIRSFRAVHAAQAGHRVTLRFL
jgi:hypothetical protein